MKKIYNTIQDEIKNSESLQIYGAFLGLIHLLTAYSWFSVSLSDPAVCWPFFENCQFTSQILKSVWSPLIGLYGIFSIMCVFFFFKKHIRFAFGLFAILTCFKFLIQVSDFRLMGNYHYMSQIISLLFLFSSHKKNSIKIFLVFFYVSAGLIKFNSDWLSGAAMLAQPWISGKWLEWACAYVIVLELIVSWFLLSPNKYLKQWALFQIVIFHLFSWHIVGYFYPLIMLSLISAFFLFPEPMEPIKNISKAQWAVVVVFCMAQAYPLIFEKYSSLNGRGRILSLNMLDAKAVCETRLFIKHKDYIVEYQPQFSQAGVRIQCDPLLVVRRVDAICKDQALLPTFEDIDIDHQTRFASSLEKTEQMSFKNVCKNRLLVGILGHVEQK